ncbi:GDSL-type esterase/lipase family protein [Paenibacillus sp. PDC88]|uniref:GDSL-type esterase/lipase family protein n=1 Tax=Paenibacillus sp. PDC88 TaxID=1884375 RepID=UPI000897595A|nr:GDSL-type esterase/lipase family protein [Paenibacillus sp. PDC88]SDW60677.1 Lysophospholipase L1 [Paenibacillus sp. PDC88]
MKSSTKIWAIVSTTSIIVTIVLITGFVLAVQDIIAPSGNTVLMEDEGADREVPLAAPIEQSKEIKVAAIGDSLAKGTGDDDGKGFIRRVVGMLQDEENEVRVTANLAINGLTTEGLLPQLDETGVQYVLKQSNLILLSIGGNDLFKAAQAYEEGAAELPDAEELYETLPGGTTNLKEILRKIAEINPEAWIVYVGLYNPFNDLPDMKLLGNTVVSAWNSQALQLINTDDQMMMAETFDLFEHSVPQLLASDHFHPNAQGYEEIAERIIEVLGIHDVHGQRVKTDDE